MMGVLETIQAETRRRAQMDSALTIQIAEYLAVEARDEMSRFYVNQAEEILAMVREADRAPALQAAE